MFKAFQLILSPKHQIESTKTIFQAKGVKPEIVRILTITSTARHSRER